MSISEITKECKEIAEEHGFKINTTDLTLNVPTALSLIHTEVSEALQEYRKGNSIGEELADIINSENIELDKLVLMNSKEIMNNNINVLW